MAQEPKILWMTVIYTQQIELDSQRKTNQNEWPKIKIERPPGEEFNLVPVPPID